MREYKLVKPLVHEFFNTTEPGPILSEVLNHNWKLKENQKLYRYDDDGCESKIALTDEKLKELTEEIMEDSDKSITEKLGITPGPWFDENTSRPERKYYGMRGCGSYSKDIFYMTETWRTDPEDDHNGDELEANKRIILSAPDMLESLIEIQEFLPELSSFPKTETRMGHVVKKTINAIEKATSKSWDDIKELIK